MPARGSQAAHEAAVKAARTRAARKAAGLGPLRPRAKYGLRMQRMLPSLKAARPYLNVRNPFERRRRAARYAQLETYYRERRRASARASRARRRSAVPQLMPNYRSLSAAEKKQYRAIVGFARAMAGGKGKRSRKSFRF